MSRKYKNILRKPYKAYGPERRENLAKEISKDSTPLPLPLEYKDIDEEFKRWVDEDLSISFEGNKVPTITLFSNQRFTEYMQSWDKVDDKKNLLLNFKTISRENNPKAGTIVGNTRNIPGERTYLMRRIEVHDRAGRTYYKDYRVKQPFSVDFIYTVTIVTNKYEMLNEFNQLVNDKFKAIDCYIRPNGHFIPMKLNDISDESEYSIDDRQYYSQSYNILVMAYIIPEDSMVVVERPRLTFLGLEGDAVKHSYAEIEELPCDYEKESDYAFVPINIKIYFEQCDSKYTFTIDTDFVIKHIVLENVRGFELYVNDTLTECVEGLRFNTNDIISVKKMNRFRYAEPSIITFEGVDPTTTYKKEEGVDEKTIELS